MQLFANQGNGSLYNSTLQRTVASGPEPGIRQNHGPLATAAGVAKEYPYFDQYWEEPNDRYPYLIRSGSTACGFAFVRSSKFLEVAEFYVAPEYRRVGIGKKVVNEFLSMSDGVWSVEVLRGNDVGLSFWRSALKDPLVVNLEEKRTSEGFRFDFVSFEAEDDV